MDMTTDGSKVKALRGAEADAALKAVREGLIADRLIPYLGPGLLALSEGAAVPSTPVEIAAALHARAPAPSRIRTNMWSVAQFIEQRRHRRTLQGWMAEIFAGPTPPGPLHRFLADQKLSLIVDSWYDSAMRQALEDSTRTDIAEIQGVTRALEKTDIWTRAYRLDGQPLEGDIGEGATVLYAPHGGVRPAANFLVADSDYVEVLTEIDIQTPIPDIVKSVRTTRGFVFLGCRFDDQMLRTYARQIMKRSAGPHHAVIDASILTRNEERFLIASGITVIDVPLGEAVQSIVGAA